MASGKIDDSTRIAPFGAPSSKPGKRHKLSSLKTAILTASALIPLEVAAAPSESARLLSGIDMIGLSATAGILSVSLIAAFVFMRRRAAIESENREIRTALSDAQSRISRFEALVADKIGRASCRERVS
jgi:hypothetical protein